MHVVYSNGSHFDKTRPSSLNFEFYTVYMQCCYRASFNLVYLFVYISIMSIHMHACRVIIQPIRLQWMQVARNCFVLMLTLLSVNLIVPPVIVTSIS